MLRNLILGGFDPALRNFGMVKGEYSINHAEFELTDMSLVTTTNEKATKTVRTNSHDIAEIKHAYTCIKDFYKDVDIIAVEAPVGAQSAAAMKSYGVCVALIATLPQPLMQLTAKEIKFVATGKKTATKKEMISWATQEFPDAAWLRGKRNGAILNSNEHLADALGAIYAASVTDEFKQLILPFKIMR